MSVGRRAVERKRREPSLNIGGCTDGLEMTLRGTHGNSQAF